MNQYIYDGPVMEFDTCVANRWQGSTYAASEKKAKIGRAQSEDNPPWKSGNG